MDNIYKNNQNIFLDRNSALPLYYQLKEHIKEAILKGVYKPEDRLPTEEELCKQLSISRPVVRQAYDELIKEGMIGRIKGSGTFVRQQADKSSLFKDFVNFSFEKNIENMEKDSKIVKMEKIIDSRLNARMGLSETDELIHIVRITHELEYPISMIESYLPCRYFPNIEDYMLMSISKPIFELVEIMYGICIMKAKRNLTATQISDEKAAFLHGDANDLTFEIETKYLDGFGRSVLLEYVTYLTSKMKFAIELNRK